MLFWGISCSGFWSLVQQIALGTTLASLETAVIPTCNDQATFPIFSFECWDETTLFESLEELRGVAA
jgi:hypothetical protein